MEIQGLRTTAQSNLFPERVIILCCALSITPVTTLLLVDCGVSFDPKRDQPAEHYHITTVRRRCRKKKKKAPKQDRNLAYIIPVFLS